MSAAPRLIDLLRAGEALLADLPIRNARLRVVSGGIRYASPVLRLDLLRNRIVLQDVKPLPLDRQGRLLPAIQAVARALGFAPIPVGSLGELPLSGAVLAVHPLLLDGDAFGTPAAGHETRDIAPRQAGPSPSTMGESGETELPDEEPEMEQDDESPGLDL